MIKFFKNRVIRSNEGISIILAIIIIIMLGLAGSIFAYLTASGSITSRSNLVSAAAKYAAKSGVEITLYELEPRNGGSFSNSQLSGCPTTPVLPPGVSGTPTPPYGYLSANSSGNSLQGNLKTIAPGTNYTPTFCAVEGALTGGGGGCGGGGYKSYVITSNGFAGGTQREVTAEVGIHNGTGVGVICAETELSNSN
jgi:hypothetical protein